MSNRVAGGQMKFIVEQRIVELGIHDVVVGVVRNVDTAAIMPESFEQIVQERERQALSSDVENLRENPIVNGYRELVRSIGRSLKKNPPTVEALVKNIQRRGSMPRINSVVDIYNVETLSSFLSIGAHDLDTIQFPIVFSVLDREDVFYPISAPEKRVAAGDYVYRDSKGIMAYLDCRDSEHYKVSDKTKNILFVIQGNKNTSIEYRKEALDRICAMLRIAHPDVSYDIFSVSGQSCPPGICLT